MYCCNCIIDEKTKKFYLKETDVFSLETTTMNMNPLIFYRVKQPAVDLDKLPVIKLDKFYDREMPAGKQIKFTVKKMDFLSGDERDYTDQISDPEIKENFVKLDSFL